MISADSGSDSSWHSAVIGIAVVVILLLIIPTVTTAVCYIWKKKKKTGPVTSAKISGFITPKRTTTSQTLTHGLSPRTPIKVSSSVAPLDN